jgi:hypothetical protein
MSQTVAQAPIQRSLPLRAALICVIGGAICITVPFATHVSVYMLTAVLLACVVGPLLRDWHDGKLDYFEPIHVLGLTYFIYFGLGAMWTVQDPGFVAYDIHIVSYIPKALLIVVLGYMALLAGYYGPWFPRKSWPTSEERLRGTLFLLVPSALGALGFGTYEIMHRLSGLGVSVGVAVSSLSQFSPFFIFAWGLSWMLLFSGQMTRSQLWCWLGFVVPAAFGIAYITVSNKTMVLTLVVTPVIALWFARRRVPWAFLTAFSLVLIFVIFPFYNTYRLTDRKSRHSQRLESTYRRVAEWNPTMYMDQSWGTFKRRMALINSVAVVARDVGVWQPYARGETIFVPALAYFIPRVLWPDKPVTREGIEFAEKFRVTSVFDKETSVAITVPGELYWNWDLPGVLLGMAVLGALLKLLYRRYGVAFGADPVRRAIYIIVLFQVLGLDSSLAVSMVFIIRTILMLEVMRWLARATGVLYREPVAAHVPSG